MRAYAEGTTVPMEKSRAEIERTLTRYGAVKFGSFSEPGRACIQLGRVVLVGEVPWGRLADLPSRVG